MTLTEHPARQLALDGTHVGRVFASRDVKVDFSSSALYAAAIGAERDVYLDDRTPGGALAPPCFLTSLEWPLVSGPEFLTAIDMRGDNLFRWLLHAFQDSAFHRPIRVGDRLRLEAALASVTKTPTGALVVTRIRTTEARSNQLVGESWFGSYFRDMTVVAPRSALEPPAIVSPGAMEIFRTPLTISLGRSHIYSECARLRNPIHTDLSFATSLALPDVALHGTLLWAMMGEIAIDRYADGNPERLRRLALRFRRPIFPNRALIVGSGVADADLTRIALHLQSVEPNERLGDGLAIIA